jgi:hypothetical protein
MVTTASPIRKPELAGEPYRFTRESYEAMIEAGILQEDERVELIAGKIINKMPIGPYHASAVNRCTQVFSNAVGRHCLVSVQNPIALDEFSQPEPDIALLRPRADFYSGSHPTPRDVLLIIEIGDTSVLSDRQRKIPLYASAGVAEIWLLNLVDKSLSRHLRPVDGVYKEISRHLGGETLSIGTLPEAQIQLSSLGL